MAVLSAPLIPLSAYLMGRRYGRGVALTAFAVSLLTPLYLVYGKAPLYALFGFSFGALSLSLRMNGKRLSSHAVASLSLALDWTALPLTLPVLYDIRRKPQLIALHLPVLLLYVLWIVSFSSAASQEVTQRLPTPWDVALASALVPLRMLLFGGPALLPGIIALLKRNNTLRDLHTPLVLQAPFVLLWADFYVHHVPYIFNFLPLLAVPSAVQLVRLNRTIRGWFIVLSLIYATALTYTMAYPYRLFSSSRAGCVLLSMRGESVRVTVSEGRPPPKSLRLLLTLLTYDPHSPTLVRYGVGEGETIILHGDTLTVSGGTGVPMGCKDRSPSPVDVWILRMKGTLKVPLEWR